MWKIFVKIFIQVNTVGRCPHLYTCKHFHTLLISMKIFCTKKFLCKIFCLNFCTNEHCTRMFTFIHQWNIFVHCSICTKILNSKSLQLKNFEREIFSNYGNFCTLLRTPNILTAKNPHITVVPSSLSRSSLFVVNYANCTGYSLSTRGGADVSKGSGKDSTASE